MIDMKKMCFLACACALSPAWADNNLHFTGNLVANVCTLTLNGNTAAEVVFPPLSAGDLLSSDSAPVDFSFQLNDCDSSLSSGVRVSFSGNVVSELPGFLMLDAGSTASGIGIGIKTTAGDAVAVNDSAGATFTLTSGNNTLHLNAVVRAIPGAEIAPGAFSSSATAMFEYL